MCSSPFISFTSFLGKKFTLSICRLYSVSTSSISIVLLLTGQRAKPLRADQLNHWVMVTTHLIHESERSKTTFVLLCRPDHSSPHQLNILLQIHVMPTKPTTSSLSILNMIYIWFVPFMLKFYRREYMYVDKKRTMRKQEKVSFSSYVTSEWWTWNIYKFVVWTILPVHPK